MSYNFTNFKDKLKELEDWLSKEFSGIRTGMASPTLLDSVKVENYGSVMPINQVANIGVEDAKTLIINPWDASQIKEIEKAVNDADLGVSVSVGGTGIRISFPDLTSERRILLIKTAKEKLEKAKVSLRSERDSVWDNLQEQQREGEISEDEKFRYKDEMQKIVDETISSFESMFYKKEKEVSI